MENSIAKWFHFVAKRKAFSIKTSEHQVSKNYHKKLAKKKLAKIDNNKTHPSELDIRHKFGSLSYLEVLDVKVPGYLEILKVFFVCFNISYDF